MEGQKASRRTKGVSGANAGVKAGFNFLTIRAFFVSGDVTPLFGLAAGISDYFDHTWSVAGPAYALALLDGFGRMGHHAHWFSDVVGAGLLGVGTTELLLWLHRQHQQDLSRFRIFPVMAPADRHGQPPTRPAGLGFSFNF